MAHFRVYLSLAVHKTGDKGLVFVVVRVLEASQSVQQIAFLGCVFGKPAIVESLAIVKDNEWHDIVLQTLFKQYNPSDPAITILERMYTFKAVMEVCNILKGHSDVFKKPEKLVNVHWHPFWVCRSFSAHFIGQGFPVASLEPAQVRVVCPGFQQQMIVFNLISS